ncbi:rhomboid-like protein [Streptomyces sp. SLBN-115]|uniref:rhomboid-like protein n=1 Tax=Streptomyces sp. SLBN-115 TaxID=2768453 RepID=UPI00114F9870
MERKERRTVERTAAPTSPPLPDVRGLLDGIPGQRPPPRGRPPAEPPAEAAPRRRYRVPVPFTLSYAAVLAGTSFLTAHVGPSLVHALHQGSSTDVAHLVRTPVLVLVASALWVAGGLASPFTLGFLAVLTTLERRIGGVRTAVVFLFGHVLATLATEVPVGLAVLVGRLPESSLHRLDYGISFGVAASVGALAGLLGPWLRWPLLAAFGGMLLQELIAFTDPMTNWGHLIALGIGVGTWPWLRRLPRSRPLRPAPTVSPALTVIPAADGHSGR